MREAVKAANTYPMMSQRRLVIIVGFHETSASDQEAFLDYLDEPAKHTVFVVSAPVLDKRTVLFKRLAEKACVVEFPRLKDAALERWAESYFRTRRCRISSSALKKVVELAGTDLQSLVNEIEKLLLYAGAERLVLDSAVEDLVQNSRLQAIFKLTAAMGKRDRGEALRLLGNMMDSGEPALVIITMMARHFRQLLIAKDLLEQRKSPREAAAAAQVMPFLFDEFMSHVKAIDWSTACSLFIKLAEVDYRFKSTQAGERMVLEGLICSL
jgi:DNA polymerase-3 subunit delta